MTLFNNQSERAGLITTIDVPETVDLFFKGVATPNPGQAGYAAVVMKPNEIIAISDGVEHASSNEMELRAAIAGLSELKQPTKVRMHGNSKYVTDNAAKYLGDWEATGFMRTNGKPRPNAKLWEEFASLVSKHKMVWEPERSTVYLNGKSHVTELADEARERQQYERTVTQFNFGLVA